MNGIHGLERPDHHLELDDLAVVVARNDVNTIDCLAIDRGLKFEHRMVSVNDFFRVTELAR